MADISSTRTVTYTITLTEEEAIKLYQELDYYVNNGEGPVYRLAQALNSELYANNSL